jgi:hypothetical protein
LLLLKDLTDNDCGLISKQVLILEGMCKLGRHIGAGNDMYYSLSERPSPFAREISSFRILL